LVGEYVKTLRPTIRASGTNRNSVRMPNPGATRTAPKRAGVEVAFTA
jgi:hypothetical protein